MYLSCHFNPKPLQIASQSITDVNPQINTIVSSAVICLYLPRHCGPLTTLLPTRALPWGLKDPRPARAKQRLIAFALGGRFRTIVEGETMPHLKPVYMLLKVDELWKVIFLSRLFALSSS